MDKRVGLPHNPERHERAKVRFELDREPVEARLLLARASRHLHPRDSDLHLHFRTLEGRASGHVERIAVEPGAVLAVPGTRHPRRRKV